MADIWRARDRAGREVALTEAGMTLLDERPWMAGWEDGIRNAIERPDFVNGDAEYPRRECFYQRAVPSGPWLKVVVNYVPVPPQGTWIGAVITAYPTWHRKRKERHLWP